MKTIKHVLMILLVSGLVMSLYGCKNKDHVIDDEPVIQEEDKKEPVKQEEDKEEDKTVDEPVKSDDKKTGIRPEFKEAMDSYEAFFDEYIAFMQKYANSNDTISMLSDYMNYLTQYTETMNKMDEIDEDELSDEEAIYYAEVSLRISKKLAEAGN